MRLGKPQSTNRLNRTLHKNKKVNNRLKKVKAIMAISELLKCKIKIIRKQISRNKVQKKNKRRLLELIWVVRREVRI